MPEATLEMVKDALRARYCRFRAKEKANQEATDALPPEKQSADRPCPSCGQEARLFPDQECLSCLIKQRPDVPFESKPYYNRHGDMFTWLFENRGHYMKWHREGFHTFHDMDDDHVVGFSIWGASQFCAELFSLIMEEE